MYRNFKQQRKQILSFVSSKGYKFYPKDQINLRRALEPTMFYKYALKPYPYDIIDTGTGKLFKITTRGRVSFTYTIYIDYVDCPDLMISKRTAYSSVGLTFFPYSKHGFYEVNVNGISDRFTVFGKDNNMVVNCLIPIADELSNSMEGFCIEVSQKVFICYDYKKRPKAKDLELYIDKCQEIRNILRRNG